MKVYQIPDLQDNYVHILKNSNGETAVVDPSTADSVNQFLEKKKWSLDYILNTHHHYDHVGGNKELKRKWGCTIIGFEKDKKRIPCISQTVQENEEWVWGDQVCRILFIPGHTLGHIAYWFKNSNTLFCGDTLFSMGCGRLFEGTPVQMFQSLNQIKNLPVSTQIYCGHEYSKRNAQFALEIECNNPHLQRRFKKIIQIREKNQSTVPFLLSEELQTNPFLRTKEMLKNPKLLSSSLRKWFSSQKQVSELHLWTKIRLLKDQY